MNKTDAAKFLGIGVRSLERYTSARKVTANKIKVKTGFALDYEPGELERFRAWLEAERQEQMQASPVSPPESPAAHSKAIQRHGGTNLARLAANAANDGEAVFIASMALQAIAHKVLLKLPECAALTGLSREHLRDAIAVGDLKAKKIGNAWRVKRADLDSYIKSL